MMTTANADDGGGGGGTNMDDYGGISGGSDLDVYETGRSKKGGASACCMRKSEHILPSYNNNARTKPMAHGFFASHVWCTHTHTRLDWIPVGFSSSYTQKLFPIGTHTHTHLSR